MLERAIGYARFSGRDYRATATQIREQLREGAPTHLSEVNAKLSDELADRADADSRLLEWLADDWPLIMRVIEETVGEPYTLEGRERAHRAMQEITALYETKDNA